MTHCRAKLGQGKGKGIGNYLPIWLLTLNILDNEEYAKVIEQVKSAMEDGKDLTVVKKELTEKYGLDPEWK